MNKKLKKIKKLLYFKYIKVFLLFIMIRLNKEYKINIRDNVTVKLGTVNRINPITFYILGKLWISPLFYQDNYKNLFNNVFIKLKKELYNFLIKNNLSDKYIIDFDITYDSLEVNSYNYFSYEIVMKQKNNIKSLKELKYNLSEDIIILINNFYNNIENMNFSIKQEKR